MADQMRTPSELGKLEYNYFEAYQIPLEETNADNIKKKINMLCTKKANSSNPIDVRIGKDLKQDALEVMSDSSKRAAEAANYKRLKMDIVRQFVISLCNRGVINKSELQQIATKNKIAFDELEKEIKPLLSSVKYIDDTQNVFDFSTYENAEKYLKGYLNGTHANLFSLLGLSSSCSVTDAKNKLESEKRANAAQAQKKTPDGIALKNLYGEAGKIFSGDDAKLKAYYKYVTIKDSVYAPLKARKDNGLTSIDQDEYLEFIQTTSSLLKESVTDAEQDLAAILKYCSIKLTGDVDLGGKKIELCPYPDCGKPYIFTPDLKACPHCGRSFEIVCWNCKGSMTMSKGAKVCPHCGVSDKAQTDFNTRVGALDILMRNPKSTVVQLKNSLTELISVVPSYNRVATSETAKKVSFYNSEITRREQAEQADLKLFMEGIAQIDKSIALKEYKKADVLLADLQKKIPGFNVAVVEKYKKDISAEIVKAQTFIAAAKRYVASNNEALAIDNAIKALEICSDNEEARQIMRKVPPVMPSNLRCSIKNNKTIYIEWNAPAGQKGVTYSVVRKAGAKPQSVTDGTVIAKDITLNFYEDVAVTAATPYYYGVFSERYGVQSPVISSPAGTSIFPDVYDVKQEMVEGKIKISWACPTGVTAVKVRKAKGTVAPVGSDGTEIKTEGTTGFTDGDCDNLGCSYSVYCEYTVGNVKKQSNGIQLFFKPYYIPKVPENIELKHSESGEYTLKGTHIESGTKLYLFTKKPTLSVKKADAIVQLSAVSSSAVQIPLASNGDDGYIFSVPATKTGWLYFINMNDQLFAASEPRFVTGERGVSDVSYTEKNGTVSLAFKLSPSVYQVMVKVSNTGYSASTADGGTNYTFSSEQIKRNGGIDIKVLADSLSYITLFGYVGSNKEYAECAPVQLDDVIDYRKKQVVKYSMSYEPNQAKEFFVTVKFEADEDVPLPDFVIVRGSPRPLNKSAGEPVGKICGAKLSKGLFSHGKYCGKAQVKVPPMAKFIKLAMFVAEDNVKHVQMKEVTNL